MNRLPILFVATAIVVATPTRSAADGVGTPLYSIQYDQQTQQYSCILPDGSGIPTEVFMAMSPEVKVVEASPNVFDVQCRATLLGAPPTKAFTLNGGSPQGASISCKTPYGNTQYYEVTVNADGQVLLTCLFKSN